MDMDKMTVCGYVWEGDALQGSWHTQLDGHPVELWYDGVWRWRIGDQHGVLRGVDQTPQGVALAMATLIQKWASQEL